ncbi:MAG TPA: DUF481 domain-containing protein [Cytophagales bacterium]|nr:DUF481 domain-containing protein [Cytophagales bacterium]
MASCIQAQAPLDTAKIKDLSFFAWMKKYTNAKYALDGNYSKGNVNRSLVSNRLTFNYNYKIYEFNLSGSYIYGKQNLIKTEDDFILGITSNIWDESITYVWGTGTIEKSFSRGILNRENLGAGLGFNIIPKEKDKNLSLTYGYLYENTDFRTTKDIETVRASVRIKGKHLFFKKLIHFHHETFIQPSIVIAENYRWRTLLSLEIPFNKHMNFKSGYQYIYENVVDPGKKKGDRNLTFGLSFSY